MPTIISDGHGGCYMKCLAALLIALLLFQYEPAFADEIYSWVGKDGTKWFSSEPPPEGIQQFEVITTPGSRDGAGAPANSRRPGYDQMVDQAGIKADALENERLAKERRAEVLKKRQAEKERRAKNQARRQQLEEKIAAIRNRAVSPTYSQGMKEAQILEIQKQIDQLKQ
jgi:hypothetical protein